MITDAIVHDSVSPAGRQPGSLQTRPRAPRLVFQPLGRLFVIWALVAGMLGTATHIRAQEAGAVRTSLNGDYVTGRLALAEGDLPLALRRFRDAQRGAQRFGTAYWVDSICYQTMWGECLYQMGDTVGALARYEDALGILVQHPDWMRFVQYPGTLTLESRPVRANITWGARTTQLPRFPEQMPIQQGTLNPGVAIEQGMSGVVMPARMVPVDVVEVTYCTALAMRRRNELLGPVARFTPLSAQLYAIFQGRTYPVNHWSHAWAKVLHGLAAAGQGERKQAVGLLKQGVVMPGNFDHPLTAIALHELARLAWEENQLVEAAALYLEGTIAAAEFFQGDLVEEGWRHVTSLHLASSQHGVLPGLGGAATWAQRAELPRTRAGLMVTAAMNTAEEGLPQEALTLLENARRVTRHRQMWVGPLFHRLRFAQATAQFRANNHTAGHAALAEAVKGCRASSPWVMHIRLASKALEDRVITPRVATGLFRSLLNDPADRHWQLDPLQTLAVITTPCDAQFNQWLSITLGRNNIEVSLEVYDRYMRRKYLESLPYGGRQLALGFIANGPQHLLGKISGPQREFLYAKYPTLAQAAHQSQAMRTSLTQQQRALPALPVARNEKLEPQVEESLSRFKRLAGQYGDVQTALAKEARSLVTSHNPSNFIFVPLRPFDTVRDRLPRRHAVLAFIPQPRNWIAVLVSPEIDRGNYVFWNIPMAPVRTRVAGLLKSLGNASRDHRLSDSQLQAKAWEPIRQELSQLIFQNAPTDALKNIDELAIVPDGLLWYLPFEMLAPIGESPESFLGQQMRVRYLPLFSLAGPKSPAVPVDPTTFVYYGHLGPGSALPEDQQQQFVDRMQENLSGSHRLIPPLPAPSSVLATSWPRLVVLSDLGSSGSADLAWSPTTGGTPSPAETISAWLEQFGHGPHQIVLPGFHSAAEGPLRKGAGEELFLAACNLSVAGARTTLLSRWRVGGASTYRVMQEFVQELPYISAAEAWQRSVKVLMATELDPRDEPRVEDFTPGDVPLTADHPFFWAGYLLVDDGQTPLAANDPQLAANPPAVDVEDVAPLPPDAPPPVPAEEAGDDEPDADEPNAPREEPAAAGADPEKADANADAPDNSGADRPGVTEEPSSPVDSTPLPPADDSAADK